MSDYEALLAEHKQLNVMRDRLQAITEGTGDALSDARRRDLLATELQGFSSAIAAHFGHEEQGGYFSEVRARRPELSPQIERLQAQHEELVGQFVALTEAARTDAAITEVAARVHQALETLAQHEHDEDALLQDGMLTDIGAHD